MKQAGSSLFSGFPWKSGLVAFIQPAGWPPKESIWPFRCLPAATSIVPSGRTVVEWQGAQVASVAPGASARCRAPGKPWQEPQADCVPSTFVHCGRVAVPPSSVAPWQ